MLALVGSRVWYRTIGTGVFHCERCGGDRPYRHRSGRRCAHLLGIPVAALGDTGEHLRCTECHTCYRVELLAVPTMEQMLLALQSATEAAVIAMLSASGGANRAARRRGILMIRAAGAPEFNDAGLTAALAECGLAEDGLVDDGPAGHGPAEDGLAEDGPLDHGPANRPPGTSNPAIGLRPAIEAFAIQLEMPAREWFLAKIVEVGLADGSLSRAERAVAEAVARYLGMTTSQGEDVISLAEEAAQAG
jgi:hypothetical protein